MFKIFLFLLILFVSVVLLDPLRLAGDFIFSPTKITKVLEQDQAEFIQKGFDGVDFDKIRDVHTHVIGFGHGNSGIKLPDGFGEVSQPKTFLKKSAFLRASGVSLKSKNIDRDYLLRLRDLIHRSDLKYKHHILAFDKTYGLDGKVLPGKTEIYVPNSYIFQVASETPELFEPVISVHPYRKDAVERLGYWANKGVKYIKWLPNAMGIDPSHPSIKEYYQTVIKNDMTILSHAGWEKTVKSEGFQKLGHPQLLKVPLEMGVSIIAAHCASSGEFEDFNQPGKTRPAIDMLFELMKNKKYDLRADLSAIMLTDRSSKIIDKIIAEQEVHEKLVYASDYPIPAINVVINLNKLVKNGNLAKEAGESLRDIYKANPLLFNFLLVRHLKHSKSGAKLPPSAFYL